MHFFKNAIWIKKFAFSAVRVTLGHWGKMVGRKLRRGSRQVERVV